MRAPTLSLLLTLLVAACSSGGYIVIREPVPVYAPAPAPEPEPLEPLEVTIVRPLGDRLLVQTNRPAYVAIFEIVPEHGVALMHPSSYRQRTVLVSGMNWLDWPNDRAVYHRTSYEPRAERYIYALASDEPLLLSPSIFQDGHLRRLLGSRTYSATQPYATMRTLSRELVPRVYDEEWAEDVYVMVASRQNERYRVARIHCPGGRVYEVPADAVHRAWCPGDTSRPSRGGDGTVTRRSAPRPDSIIVRDDDDKGWRVWEQPEVATRRRTVDRVEEPARGRTKPGSIRDVDDREDEKENDRTDDRRGDRKDDADKDRDNQPGNGQARGHDKEHPGQGNARGHDKEHPGQGNAYGHDKDKANGRARGHDQERDTGDRDDDRENKNSRGELKPNGRPEPSPASSDDSRLKAPEGRGSEGRRPIATPSEQPAQAAPPKQEEPPKEEPPKEEPSPSPAKAKPEPKQKKKSAPHQPADSTSRRKP